jgi:hypothetical protein
LCRAPSARAERGIDTGLVIARQFVRQGETGGHAATCLRTVRRPGVVLDRLVRVAAVLLEEVGEDFRAAIDLIGGVAATRARQPLLVIAGVLADVHLRQSAPEATGLHRADVAAALVLDDRAEHPRGHMIGRRRLLDEVGVGHQVGRIAARGLGGLPGRRAPAARRQRHRARHRAGAARIVEIG